MLLVAPQCFESQCPVPHDEICCDDSKVGLGLLFKVFKQLNKDGAINSLSVQNKTDLPLTIQLCQQFGSWILWKPSEFMLTF